MRRNVRIVTFENVRPAKIKTSLPFRAVWSESSLGEFWIVKDTKFLHTINEDTDRTAWMHRLSEHMSEGTFSQSYLFYYFYLFKQCLKRMTQLAINNYSTLWSSN